MLERRALLLLVSTLGGFGSVAGQSLVKDIRLVPQDDSAAFTAGPMFDTGSSLLFGAGKRATDLYVSDGTSGGTTLLADLDPSARASASPSSFVKLANGLVLFHATNSQSTGRELYRTDGTSAGTFLVTDIAPGIADGPGRENMVAIGNKAVFFANSAFTGLEPWVSDGTAGGTTLLRDIRPGLASSISLSPAPTLTVMNGRAYFPANDGVSGTELWSTDGTTAGTSKVAEIHPTGSANPSELTTLGNLVIFSADDGATGSEPYRSDGTAAGTFRIGDLISGSSFPTKLTVVGSDCFFVALAPGLGAELWKTDGATVTFVKDVLPGAGNSAITMLGSVGGQLLFTASDGSHGRELWKSDGSPAGTQLVVDLTPGSTSTFFNTTAGTAVLGTAIVFSASVGTAGTELWSSDGTAAGTFLVKDIRPGSDTSVPLSLTTFGGRVFFNADDGVHGRELWATDLTPGGTAMVAQISPPIPGSSGITEWVRLGDRLIFDADDGVIGDELWSTDGTGAGTQLVLDIDPAQGASGKPRGFFAFGNQVLFCAQTLAEGTELWTTDGTPAGTHLVLDIHPGSTGSSPANFVEFQGKVYFTAAESFTATLWSTDGTAAGTSKIGGPNVNDLLPGRIQVLPNLLVIQGGVGFSSTQQLWRSDGTVAGTVQIDPVNPVINLNPAPMIANHGLVFFFGTRGADTDLWCTDGTAAGTTHLLTILPGGGANSPIGPFVSFGNQVFFAAKDTTGAPSPLGAELYVSDGTPSGTHLVKDIWPGSAGSLPFGYGTLLPVPMTAGADAVYFEANDGSHGYELWRSDGTSAGTTLVRDLAPGAIGAMTDAGVLVNVGVGTRVVFAARTAATGQELWVTDGTSAGTQLLVDLDVGAGDGVTKSMLVVLGDTVLFVGNDGTTGNELFALPLAALRAADFVPVGTGCPGSGSLVPATSGSGLPVPGRTFSVDLEQAFANSPAAILINGLRQDLPIGGGCTLYPMLPGVTFSGATSPTGSAAFPIAVPANPAFVGVDVHFQWIVLDPGGAWFSTLAFSNGLKVRLGES